jgi:hypothetical protein
MMRMPDQARSTRVPDRFQKVVNALPSGPIGPGTVDQNNILYRCRLCVGREAQPSIARVAATDALSILIFIATWQNQDYDSDMLAMIAM